MCSLATCFPALRGRSGALQALRDASESVTGSCCLRGGRVSTLAALSLVPWAAVCGCHVCTSMKLA